ncbi:hypothetical protein RIR_jg16499.t1 [Rhizophagus irregularis DAOM 181602=DAOM 197198]|nr:hypothetical protein RIR_jg16499.t1 [Rhizophagus irregularis DAOM 181602=DAOM 197198]
MELIVSNFTNIKYISENIASINNFYGRKIPEELEYLSMRKAIRLWRSLIQKGKIDWLISPIGIKNLPFIHHVSGL